MARLVGHSMPKVKDYEFDSHSDRSFSRRFDSQYCGLFQITRERVEKGYRLPMPSGTPLKIYEIMKRCWESEPERRPNFAEIERILAAVDI